MKIQLSCTITHFMGYRPLVAWCLPLANSHHFCVTKVYICIDKTVPGLLDVTRFLSLDVTICYDVQLNLLKLTPFKKFLSAFRCTVVPMKSQQVLIKCLLVFCLVISGKNCVERRNFDCTSLRRYAEKPALLIFKQPPENHNLLSYLWILRCYRHYWERNLIRHGHDECVSLWFI